jgi:hypothetical protein
LVYILLYLSRLGNIQEEAETLLLPQSEKGMYDIQVRTRDGKMPDFYINAETSYSVNGPRQSLITVATGERCRPTRMQLTDVEIISERPIEPGLIYGIDFRTDPPIEWPS